MEQAESVGDRRCDALMDCDKTIPCPCEGCDGKVRCLIEDALPGAVRAMTGEWLRRYHSTWWCPACGVLIQRDRSVTREGAPFSEGTGTVLRPYDVDAVSESYIGGGSGEDEEPE